jgi:competence protein ComEA
VRHTMIGPMLLAFASMAAVSGAASAAAAAPALAAASAPASQAMPGHTPMGPMPRNRPKVVEHLVDINSASRKELMTLPGIGATEADKIIANRPYLTKTQLVTKGVLPTGPYLSLRYQVVAMQKLPPGAKKASTATAAKTVAPQASTPKAP